MNHKTQRLSIIRKIIRSEFICSQEELIKRLEECGVTITQSTLSRDLKFMHVAKVPHKEKGYIYILPNNSRNDIGISSNITGNICIIQTRHGFACATASSIDSKGVSEIIGTVAGDNTIMCVLKENYDMESLMSQLHMLFPSIRTL